MEYYDEHLYERKGCGHIKVGRVISNEVIEWAYPYLEYNNCPKLEPLYLKLHFLFVHR